MDAAAAVTLAEQCLTAEALRDIDISHNPELGAASDKAAAALLKLMGHKGLTVLRAQCCRLGWQAGKALIGDALTRTGTVKVGLLPSPLCNPASSSAAHGVPRLPQPPRVAV